MMGAQWGAATVGGQLFRSMGAHGTWAMGRGGEGGASWQCEFCLYRVGVARQSLMWGVCVCPSLPPPQVDKETNTEEPVPEEAGAAVRPKERGGAGPGPRQRAFARNSSVMRSHTFSPGERNQYICRVSHPLLSPAPCPGSATSGRRMFVQLSYVSLPSPLAAEPQRQ